MRAKEALYDLESAEFRYFSTRYEAAARRDWLVLHASATERASDTYFGNLRDYVDFLGQLPKFEKEVAVSLAAYNRAANTLGACNSTKCTDSYKATLGTRPAPVSSGESPEAACPECEAAALRLKRDLALLQLGKARLARNAARRDAILHSVPERDLTDGERAELNQVISQVMHIPDMLADIAKQIEADRATLDACNKAHPSTSCQVTGTSTVPVTGTAKDTGGATGQQKTGDGAKRPVIPGEPATGPAATDGPNSKSGPTPTPPSNAPTPGSPDAKTPPSGNAAPFGIPSIGSIFAPTPGIFPGTQRFNFTMPSKLDNGDGTAEEYFTFIVRDSAGLDEVFALFRTDEVVDVDIYGYQVTIAAGNDPDRTWDKLEGLWYRGEIDNVEPDPCWNAAAGGSSVPVAGAWVLYTPVSPSPSSDPGERPGDEGPPNIARVGRDGTFNAPLGGLNGPMEIRVASGCDERTTVITAGRSDRAPVAGGKPQVEEPPESNRRIANAIRATELRKP